MKKSNVLQELTRTPMSGVWSFSHGLSSHTLKIIAIMTMLIDHIAAVLMEGETGYWLLREIGRISFPIFAFWRRKASPGRVIFLNMRCGWELLL